MQQYTANVFDKVSKRRHQQLTQCNSSKFYVFSKYLCKQKIQS